MEDNGVGNKKLLSLSGSVPLNVLEIWALVFLELEFGLEVWLVVSVTNQRP